jgi:signal transduction histidine kinase
VEKKDDDTGPVAAESKEAGKASDVRWFHFMMFYQFAAVGLIFALGLLLMYLFLLGRSEIAASYLHEAFVIGLVALFLAAGCGAFLFYRHLKKYRELLAAIAALPASENDVSPHEFDVLLRRCHEALGRLRKEWRYHIYHEKMVAWQTISRRLAVELQAIVSSLTVMMGRLLEEYGDEQTPYRALLVDGQRQVADSIAEMRYMIDSFHQLAGNFEIRPVNTDLIALCQQIIKQKKAAYVYTEFQFQTELTEAHLIIDPQLFKQAVQAIVKNAAEACGSSTSSKVILKLIGRENCYALHVIDNGPGISPQIGSRVFDAFFTTKQSGAHLNMGLGLTLAQKIILAHKGDVFFESAAQHTDFQIVMPCHGSAPDR